MRRRIFLRSSAADAFPICQFTHGLGGSPC